MFATELLKANYSRTIRLLRCARRATTPARARALLHEVAIELHAHLDAEERLFYPEVNERLRDERLLALLYRALAPQRALLRRALAADDDLLPEALAALEELALRHADDEASELFPRIEAEFSEDELHALGAVVRAALDRDRTALGTAHDMARPPLRARG